MRIVVQTSVLIVIALALGSCSQSDPGELASAPEPQVSGAPEVSTSAPDAQPEATEEGQGGAIFYLEASPGCYGLSEDATDDYFIEAVDKEFFTIDCSQPHHFEVFWRGDLPSFTETKNVTQEDAEATCVTEYQKVFSEAPPSEIIPEEEQDQRPYLSWYFPDDGLEASKYPGRLICAAFESDPEYTVMKSRAGSLVSNAA